MSKGLFHVILASIVGFIFTLGGAAFLYAQEGASDEFTLEEITVTAAKRAENQQKVAISMDVISSEEIRELGKDNIDEILSSVTNVIIEKASDGYRVAIRGIADSSQAFHGMSTAQPAVAVNTDGVYSNRKDTVAGLFDIERVEVLYGPQSTMYSSNSPGGIVNVVTAQPKLSAYSVTGLVEGGNYGLLHTEGAMNVPIGDKVALRASFSTSKRDSYVTTGSDNENTKSARLRALFQPSDKFSFTLTGEYSKNKSAGFSGVKVFVHQDDKYYPADQYGNIEKLTNPWTGNSAETRPSSDIPSNRLTGQINWETGIGSLSIVPSYSTRNGNSLEIFPAQPPATEDTSYYVTVRAREKAMETRMTSPSDFFLKWIMGVNLYKSMDSQRRDSPEAKTTGYGEYSYRVMTQKSVAVYGNVTYPFTDVLRMTAGYRKSWDKTVSVDQGLIGSMNPMDPPGTLNPQDQTNESSTGGRPDYKMGFEYDLGPNSMLYGDYSTSFRANAGPGGGPPGGDQTAEGYEGQEGAGTTTTEDPEVLKAYTIGAKNRFFDNKLQLNMSAYYYDYRNYRAGNNDRFVWVYDIDNDLVMDREERFMEPYSNGTGNGRMIGVDMSSALLLTQNDMVNLSFSYVKSEWTDLKMVYYYWRTVEYVNTPTPHTEYVILRGADYGGKPMMNTPPWTVNLSYDHSFNLPNGGTIRATVSTKLRSAYRLSWADADYPNNFQEGYHMENFQAVYNSPGGSWNFSAYVKNIMNYAEKRMYMAGPGSMMTIGNPRTYGGVLSVKF